MLNISACNQLGRPDLNWQPPYPSHTGLNPPCTGDLSWPFGKRGQARATGGPSRAECQEGMRGRFCEGVA
jgi:hypothetical protein